MHKHARVLVAIALYGNEAVQYFNRINGWECSGNIFINPISMDDYSWRIHPDYEHKVPTLADIEGWRK